MNTCSYPNCSSSDKLWNISNTSKVPLQYKPFCVCDDHLKSEKVFADVLTAMCQARFESQYGDKLEKNGWMLDKRIRTWEKANDGQECDDCKQTNHLWIKTKGT
jgi:hypothetical protein